VGSSLRIGVDLDNTLVRCDRLFHRVAVEQGLVAPSLPVSKGSVRDFLRASDREEDWTRLQGEVYGPRLAEAPAFPGAREFFRRAVRRGAAVWVVSHKTRHPYLGPRHDLHRAALNWLARNGFFDADVGLAPGRVFLEPSKEDKLRRIGALRCTHFIDDLPELLAEPGFPGHTERALFDPGDEHPSVPGARRVRSWDELAKELLAA
jgi:hypothetical protein